MGGFLLHVDAQVLCLHAGRAQPTVPNPRVTVGGAATVQMPPPWIIAGCAMPPPIAGNGPCIVAQWITGSTRVTAGGVPILLFDSQAICAPTGTPVQIVSCQTRATGQ
jgi:hypothetical protein